MMEDIEVWKDVVGHEGYLEVSSFGRLRSVDRYFTRVYINSIGNTVESTQFKKGTVLKLCLHRSGYYRVSVQVEGKRFNIYPHREVCRAFNGTGEVEQVVDHINEDKLDNTPNNLRWVYRKENAVKSSAKLADASAAFTGTVVALDLVTGEEVGRFNGNKQMAEAGFDFRNVSAVLKGKRKSHKGCTFKKLYNRRDFKGDKSITLSKSNFTELDVFDFYGNYQFTIKSWEDIFSRGFTPIKVLAVLRGDARTHKDMYFKLKEEK